jgi:hypothetical protein
MPRDTHASSNSNSASTTDTSRKEPLPPTPPLLEDHPYIRILRYQGFAESDFDPESRVAVPLTRAEIRVLAQHHLDRTYQFEASINLGCAVGVSDHYRDHYNQCRFGELADLLPEEDQEKFKEIIRIRDKYIETLYNPEDLME